MATERAAGWAAAEHPWVAEGARRVRLGVFGGPREDGAAWTEWVRTVEGLGFDAVWVGDHPFRSPGCWTYLAAAAAATTRLRLGTCVAGVYHMGPALLARQAADVDRLSGGRLVLGLGAGHNLFGELEQLGLPAPGVRGRQAAVEEAVAIVRRLWAGAPFTFEGAHFRVYEASVRPGPVQRPRVPLLLAGGGERVTLRQVAELADACNFGPHATTGGAFTAADVRRKLGALRGHCAARGRSYASVLRTHWTGPVFCARTPAAARAKLEAMPAAGRELHRTALVAGAPDEVRAYLQERVDAGMQYFVTMIGGHDHETLRLLAEEVLPHLHPRPDPS